MRELQQAPLEILEPSCAVHRRHVPSPTEPQVDFVQPDRILGGRPYRHCSTVHDVVSPVSARVVGWASGRVCASVQQSHRIRRTSHAFIHLRDAPMRLKRGDRVLPTDFHAQSVGLWRRDHCNDRRRPVRSLEIFEFVPTRHFCTRRFARACDSRVLGPGRSPSS